MTQVDFFTRVIIILDYLLEKKLLGLKEKFYSDF